MFPHHPKLWAVLFLASLPFLSQSQVAIASQSWEGLGSELDYSVVPSGGGTVVSGTSTTSDRPGNSPFTSSGSEAFRVKNNEVTLTFDSVATNGYSNVSLSFDLAAFSIGSTTNGLDLGDELVVSISTDGTNFSEELRVTGNNNAYWSFAGGGTTASIAYDGNDTYQTFSPPGGGDRDGNGGISKVEITNLPSVSTLFIRIKLETTDSDEAWIIDNLELSGTAISNPTVGFTASAVTVGEGDGMLLFSVQLTGYTGTNVELGISALAGTAEGEDYELSVDPPILTFTGNQTITDTLLLNEDVDRDDETLTLSLKVTSGPALWSNQTLAVTIEDNDVLGTVLYSTGDGHFMDPSFWSTTPEGAGTVTYTAADNADDRFVIQSGDSVTIVTMNDFAVTGLEIDGVLNLYSSTVALSVNNGLDGADFELNGAFYDNGSSSNGVDFTPGTTWTMGADAMLVKMNESTSNEYRDNYEGGIATIPATANWILRYMGGSADPSISSVDGATYPNLTIESMSGNWNPATGASRFQGKNGFPTILGNLDIGGDGPGTVTFYTQNTNETPVTVKGKVIIRSGSRFTNVGNDAGTGLVAEDTVVVDGTLELVAGTGKLVLQGSGTQIVSGSGTINAQQVEVDVSGGMVDLSVGVNIQDSLTLTNGLLRLNDSNVTLLDDSTEIIGATSSKYLLTNGTGSLIQPIGTDSIRTYPVGVESSYLPATLTNNTGADDFGIRVSPEVLEDGTSGAEFTESVVDATWNITKSGVGATDLDLTVQWNAGDELPNFTRAACYISHYGAEGWDADIVDAASASGSDPYTISRSGITDLSPFAVGSNSFLPVELVFFTGRAVDEQVQLNWQTEMESNNEFFAVERSPDGRLFEEIGRVAGAGTTVRPQDYGWIDANPLNGANFYRLRQVDFDGTTAFYGPVLVQLPFGNDVRIYPNPVRDWVRIEGGGTGQQLQLIDALGRVLLERVLEGPTTDLDLRKLPAGRYTLLLTDASRRTPYPLLIGQ